MLYSITSPGAKPVSNVTADSLNRFLHNVAPGRDFVHAEIREKLEETGKAALQVFIKELNRPAIVTISVQS